MSAVDVPAGVLVILGAVMVVLGLFGGGNVPIISLGLVAIIAAGGLQVLASRSS